MITVEIVTIRIPAAERFTRAWEATWPYKVRVVASDKGSRKIDSFGTMKDASAAAHYIKFSLDHCGVNAAVVHVDEE